MRYLMLLLFMAVLAACATAPTPIPPTATAVFARQSNGDSRNPQISDNGRYIAFVSKGKLTQNSTGKTESVFVYDRETDYTELVSAALDGYAGRGRAFNIALSGSGRFVAFYSYAGNLVSDDNELCDSGTTNCADLFVYDRQVETMTRILQGIPTGEGVPDYPWVTFSPDEHYIAYSLMAGDAVYDLETGETARTLTMPDYFIPDGPSIYFWNAETSQKDRAALEISSHGRVNLKDISSGGTFVAFSSLTTELKGVLVNQCEDFSYSAAGLRPCFNLFIHDWETGETWLATLGKDGHAGNADILWPKMSADGRFLAFSAAATNLTNDDFSFCDNISQCRNTFLHNLQTGETVLVSREVNGVLPAGYSHIWDIDISGDGRFVAFASDADNLVAGDTNNVADIFVYDRQTEEIVRVSAPNFP